jgi:photosystem II stability/assembly factor-like uncharacterized protein
MTAPPACYRDLVMASANTGFAVAEEGLVVGTSNGGSDWKPLLTASGDRE